MFGSSRPSSCRSVDGEELHHLPDGFCMQTVLVGTYSQYCTVLVGTQYRAVSTVPGSTFRVVSSTQVHLSKCNRGKMSTIYYVAKIF